MKSETDVLFPDDQMFFDFLIFEGNSKIKGENKPDAIQDQSEQLVHSGL